jgi:hypothetical protein
MKKDLIERLEKRAEIRRQIPTRKSVQEGAPDRIADLLEEAAGALRAHKEFLEMSLFAHQLYEKAATSVQSTRWAKEYDLEANALRELLYK